MVNSKRSAGDRWGLPRILLIIPDDGMIRIFVVFGAFFFLRETAKDTSQPLETLSRWDYQPDLRDSFGLSHDLQHARRGRMKVVHAWNCVLIADHNPFRRLDAIAVTSEAVQSCVTIVFNLNSNHPVAKTMRYVRYDIIESSLHGDKLE